MGATGTPAANTGHHRTIRSGKRWPTGSARRRSRWISSFTEIASNRFCWAVARGNARCVVCHSRGGGNSFLEPLAPGRTTYDEEQSFRNFERVQRLVVPGAPLESILLVNPLAEEAGGSHWHAGGKHWPSQDVPEWQTLAAWVHGQTGRSQ